MTDFNNLFIVIVVITLVYIMTSDNKKSKHKSSKPINKQKKVRFNDMFNEKSNKAITKTFLKKTACSNFLDNKYHIDYNDTISAINNITPQKELFNHSFLPTKQVKTNDDNVKELVNLFIEKINYEIENNVSEYLELGSGWNDKNKRKRIKNGFEIQMEKLGLPSSLYNEPASKAPISLIQIRNSEQYMTDDQTRIVISIIVQKPNVKDQMILKILYFIEKENNYEVSLNNITKNDTQKVVIEQVFVEGFLTNEDVPETKVDRFHEYGDVKFSDGTLDQKKILNTMWAKHKERIEEFKSFKNSVSQEDKDLYNYDLIKDELERFPSL